MTATVDDRDAQMLAELAELDLSAARHVHGQLIGATETDDVASLSRAYQRASRGLRQTLALKAQLVRDATILRVKTTPISAPAKTVDLAEDQRDLQLAERISDLQEAVDTILHAAHPDDAPRREVLCERLDREMDDWIETPDFLTDDLDLQVRRACRLLDLPDELAVRWRDLPRSPLQYDGWDDLDELEASLRTRKPARRKLDSG